MRDLGPAAASVTLALALCLGVGAGVACVDDDEPDTQARIADYLRPDPYSRLVFEVDASAGLSLADDVVDPFVLVASELVAKPGGVELEVDASLAASEAGKVWTLAELEQLGEANFDLEVPADTVKIHVLLLDGSFMTEDGDELLGLAWGHRHIALFQDGIRSACVSGQGGRALGSKACRSAELGVLGHELGHVLGLVNNGVAMVEDHEDLAHPHHTLDPDCLMYWAYERRAVVTKIQDAIDAGTPAEEALGFCGPSVADLAAY